MRILRAADYKVMPWKNGLGSTTEVALAPAHDGSADFDWRVSMAQVTSDGPFSSFPGIDRTLLVLEGAGIDLSVAGQEQVRIDRDIIHSFPGDQSTTARLIDGSILDLNVMSRRDRYRHHVQRIKVMALQDFSVTAPALMMVEDGSLSVSCGADIAQLSPRDTLTFASGQELFTIESVSVATVILIKLDNAVATTHRY